MNKSVWTALIVAVVFAGGGFYAGMQYQAGQTPATESSRFGGGGGGNFVLRSGGASGGTTFGTIISTSPNSITIQLPTPTSTSASTGTKIILFDNSTQVQEMQSVPISNLSVGKTIVVSGIANVDGSITASSIQVRAAGAARGGQTSTTTQAPMIPAGQ
jgi:hypothetical protein